MKTSVPAPASYAPVLAMAGPLMISFTMRAAFTFVDTAYAATIGDAAVAAIGLAIPAEFLMIALWVGLSTGLTACLSRAMGTREEEKLEQYLAAARRLVWVLVPLFSAVGLMIWFYAPRMGLAEEVARGFQVYGAVLIGGSAFTSFWSIIPDSIVKAHHDTRTTMWAGIFSNLLNVVLNTLFLFVFHWGVFGIALSTVIGRFGGLFYALIKASAHERRRQAQWRGTVVLGLDAAPYRSIMGLAVPAALSFALMSLETAIANKILAGMPDPTASIAAYSIYYRVVIFVLNPVIAIGVAMLPYAARRFGEEDIAGVRRGLREATLAAYGYTLLLVTPVMLLIAPLLAGWLAESPLTTRYTIVALRLVPVACLMGVPFLLCRPVFEGMQKGRPGLVMAVVRYGILAGPAAWGGARLAMAGQWPGIYGLLLGLIAAALASSVVFAWWLRRDLRLFGFAG